MATDYPLQQLEHSPPGAPLPPDGEQPNGQHHLLRHVLSPEQCSDALRHFGTTDSKAAARMVNRMSQRDLRDMFQRVYVVHTNSNNNTWLRRKLLEAVGASRRFYTAANKTGRPKARRDGGDKASGGGVSKAPKAHSRSPRAQKVAASTGPQKPAVSSTAAPHAPPPGPALPAGSPRALSQRLRQRSYGDTHFPNHFRSVLAQAAQQQEEQADCPHPPSAGPYYTLPAAAQPHYSDQDTATGSERSGTEQHPRALAPFGSAYEGSSPTSAFAAPSLQQQQAAAMYSMGSNSSLHSSAFAVPTSLLPLQPSPAPRPPYTPGAGYLRAAPTPPLVPTPQYSCAQVAAVPPRMPRVASLTCLTQLLAGGLIAEQQAAAGMSASQLPATLAFAPSLGLGLAGAASMALQPSCDLGFGTLFSGQPIEMPGQQSCQAQPPSKQESATGEDWLSWDDWTLPTLF